MAITRSRLHLLTFLLIHRAVLATGDDGPIALAPGEAVVTVLGTNDIHGHLEPSAEPGTGKLGGIEWMAGYFAAVEEHHRRHHGEKGTVIVLDAGDAAQGTLLSNHSEGVLMSRLMSRMGYTAAVPGNHAYDFGPAGWRDDLVGPGTDPDPLSALKKAVAAATFPYLGTNITWKSGKPVEFLPPVHIVPGPFGRSIAIFGIENPNTGNGLTPKENVTEITFHEAGGILAKRVKELLETGAADLFIATAHEGDGGETRGLAKFLESLPRRDDGSPLLDAVVAGHTHTLNDAEAGGTPYVQSEASGRKFGMIQLVVTKDVTTGKLRRVAGKGRRRAGIPVVPRKSTFMGEPVKPDEAVRALLEEGRNAVAPVAGRVLTTAKGSFSRKCHRIADSPTGNLVADMMRLEAGTEIALINSGDIRAGLPRGKVTYADLFEAIPKNLRLITVEDMPVEKVLKNLERSARSCGQRGALQVSGLTLTFRRGCQDCENLPGGEDRKARLLKVVTGTGRVLLDREKDHEDSGTISVATTDFVMGGGSGYPHFQGVPHPPSSTDLRDSVADRMETMREIDPADHASGRYVNLGSP